MGYVILAALFFGVCYGADKLFTKLFRSSAQHKSGLCVKVSKYYAVVGIVMFILGLTALFSGIGAGDAALIVGSCVLLAVSVCAIVYYLTFGIYYDGEGFLLSSFGRKNRTYAYGDIKAQQLYQSGRNIMLELYMRDNTTVSLQLNMKGVIGFLDKAFAGWCRQQGLDPENCSFHDPDNSCWFPKMEDQ